MRKDPAWPRVVEPELLDTLSPDDPEACHSRRDLQRVNTWMGHRPILNRVLVPSEVASVLEIGAGDGTFSLKLARSRQHEWMRPVQLTLLDRQSLVTERTMSGFAALGWRVQTQECDVFAWLTKSNERFDLIYANLFLHHFQDDELGVLLRLISQRTSRFAACEPRRSPRALQATRLLWLIGCNQVTRNDARISVKAGFLGNELSALWPDGWTLTERPAGLFSHLFCAQRRSA